MSKKISLGKFVILLAVVACKADGFTSPQVDFSGSLPLGTSDWSMITHTDRNLPLKSIDGALTFEFPVGKDDDASESINYLYSFSSAPRNINSARSVSITIQVQTLSGKPVYQYKLGDKTNLCPDSARVHVLLWSSENPKADNARWFANQSFVLHDGTATLVIPLTLDQWSDVYGQRDPAAFSKMLGSVGWFGLTFGGGCYAGHGVNVRDGSVRLAVLNYSLLP